MDTFEKALKFTLQWEGGYVNHPADPGGETNFGVTKAVYDRYRISKGLAIRSVRLIAPSEVHEIYKMNYWAKAGCDALPPLLALCQFDWAVNSGCDRAIRTLQQVVGVPVDGIIGSQTRNAIASSLNTRGEKTLAANYCAVREVCYRRWGVGKQQVFLKGWLNRLAAVRACFK